MKKLLFILILSFTLFTSCTVDEIYAESEYDCGFVVGGEIRGTYYYLLVSYPDGEFYEKVTQKAYYHYNMFDEICFDTIVWEMG